MYGGGKNEGGDVQQQSITPQPWNFPSGKIRIGKSRTHHSTTGKKDITPEEEGEAELGRGLKENRTKILADGIGW